MEKVFASVQFSSPLSVCSSPHLAKPFPVSRNSMKDNINIFEFDGILTERNWLIYIVEISKNFDKLYYIGKVGDNRDGCNPIISRIGNHFSFNKIHSQLRNKLEVNTNEYNYKVYTLNIGTYRLENRLYFREKINEFERYTNQQMQKHFNKTQILNPFAGKYITKKESERRKTILNIAEKEQVENLIKIILNNGKQI